MKLYKVDGIDSRLVDLIDEIKNRTDAEVVVEGSLVIVGSVPNCAIFSVDSSSKDDRLQVAFHFDCHPLNSVFLSTVVLDILDYTDVLFTNSFLSDVNGLLTYEDDPGFDLMYIHYLRDVLSFREKRLKVFKV